MMIHLSMAQVLASIAILLVPPCLATSYTAGVVTLEVDHGKIILTVNGPSGSVLTGNIGTTLPDDITISNCTSGSLIDDHVCLAFSNGWTLQAAPHESIDGCSRLTWLSSTLSEKLTDCFLLGNAHLYGGGESYVQHWTLEDQNRIETPCVTHNNDIYFGGLVERYWLTSSGVAVNAEWNIPLWFSINATERQFCMTSKNEEPYYLTAATPQNRLSYTLCAGKNIKDVHLKWITGNNIRPTGVPDSRMVVSPTWSTWAMYAKEINHTATLDFAQKILHYNYTSSQVEIDDDWETCYGQQEFNKSRFPDIQGLVKTLKGMGHRVTLWVHPFINQNCPDYKYAKERGYFVKDRNTGEAGNAPWWDGDQAGLIDWTNDDAAKWWADRLRNLQKMTGLDSFKFDAGENNWLPQNYELNSSFSETIFPMIHTHKYVETLSQFGDMVETRVGCSTHNFPVLRRFIDKDSHWEYNNGLKTLIPSTLLSGILGYPYAFPDMVGGNGYVSFPSKELFIRWLEANVFLPAIQLSITPWYFDEETIEISKKMLDLREEYGDYIVRLYREAQEKGYPIVRSLWWQWPEDPVAQSIDSEFLLGDDILVAPVVEEGAITRDIYIPGGTWFDHLSKQKVTGPVWISSQPVQLDQLAYFTKIA